MGLLDTGLHYLMDRDWWLKYLFLFGLQGVVKIPDVLVNFRLHPESKTVSQKLKFQVEHDSFYYALARQCGLALYAHIISNVCSVKPDYTIHLPVTPDPELVEKALNYYLLFRANEFYAGGEWKKAQPFLEQVTTDLLEKEDKKLHRQLYLRNKYLPEPVIQFLRRK